MPSTTFYFIAVYDNTTYPYTIVDSIIMDNIKSLKTIEDVDVIMRYVNRVLEFKLGLDKSIVTSIYMNDAKSESGCPILLIKSTNDSKFNYSIGIKRVVVGSRSNLIVDAYGNYIIRDIYIYSPTTDYLEYAAHVLNNNLCVFDDNDVLKYSYDVSGIRSLNDTIRLIITGPNHGVFPYNSPMNLPLN